MWLFEEIFILLSDVYRWIGSFPHGPVDDVDNMAGADETDGGDKEILEVEPMVGFVSRLNHHTIKMIQDHSNIWHNKTFKSKTEIELFLSQMSQVSVQRYYE